MNAFTDTRAQKIISPYCAFGGAQCPMCAVKKTIWIFRLPMTKDETHIQRMCDGMMQMRMHETERKQHKGVIHTYKTAEIQL